MTAPADRRPSASAGSAARRRPDAPAPTADPRSSPECSVREYSVRAAAPRPPARSAGRNPMRPVPVPQEPCIRARGPEQAWRSSPGTPSRQSVRTVRVPGQAARAPPRAHAGRRVPERRRSAARRDAVRRSRRPSPWGTRPYRAAGSPPSAGTAPEPRPSRPPRCAAAWWRGHGRNPTRGHRTRCGSAAARRRSGSCPPGVRHSRACPCAG